MGFVGHDSNRDVGIVRLLGQFQKKRWEGMDLIWILGCQERMNLADTEILDWKKASFCHPRGRH